MIRSGRPWLVFAGALFISAGCQEKDQTSNPTTHIAIHHKVPGTAGGPTSPTQPDQVPNAAPPENQAMRQLPQNMTVHSFGPGPIVHMMPTFSNHGPNANPLVRLEGKQIAHEGGQSLELVALCKLDDGDLKCWNAQGEQKPALSSAVKDSLAQVSSVIPIRTYIGKKNRVAVFRQVISMNRSSDFLVSQIHSFGDAQIMLTIHEAMSPKGTMRDYPVYVCSFEKAVAKAPVVLESRAWVTDQFELPPKPRASKVFHDTTISVVSVQKNNMGMAGGGGHTWCINLQVNSPKGEFEPRVALIDLTGQRIVSADKDGKPKSTTPITSKAMPQPRFNGAPMDSIVSYSKTEGSSQLSVMTPVDPKFIRGLLITGQVINLKNTESISIDPK